MMTKISVSVKPMAKAPMARAVAPMARASKTMMGAKPMKSPFKKR